MTCGLCGSGITAQEQEFNARSYAKYVLREGTVYEKRELLSDFKSKLILTNKVLTLVE